MIRGRSIRPQLPVRLFDLGSSTDGPPILLAEGPIGIAPPIGAVERHETLEPIFRSVLVDAGSLGCSTIAVMNASSGEGSGHVAAGLALAATSLGKRVALVSGLIEPIAGLAAEELSTGLHSVLAKKKPLGEALVTIETRNGGLTYLPPGPLDPSDGLLAEHAAMADLVDELRSIVDVVIV